MNRIIAKVRVLNLMIKTFVHLSPHDNKQKNLTCPLPEGGRGHAHYCRVTKTLASNEYEVAAGRIVAKFT
jgi:hypothetical protein